VHEKEWVNRQGRFPTVTDTMRSGKGRFLSPGRRITKENLGSCLVQVQG